MTAEERAENMCIALVIAERYKGYIAEQIREAEQQARKMLQQAVDICDKQADEWASDNVQTYKNYPAYCAAAIRMLIEREAE